MSAPPSTAGCSNTTDCSSSSRCQTSLPMSPLFYCNYLLPKLSLRIISIAETCFVLHRCREDDARFTQKRVFRIRTLEAKNSRGERTTTSTTTTTTATGSSVSDSNKANLSELLVSMNASQEYAVVAGDSSFLPGHMVAMELREVHNGEADCGANNDDGRMPNYREAYAATRCVVQFAPSVEWHRLCVLGESAATVNWVQPTYPQVDDASSHHRSSSSSTLTQILSEQRDGLPFRNVVDCHMVEVSVFRHDTEACSGAVGTRILSRGVECYRKAVPRTETALNVLPLQPLAVYSAFVKAIYCPRGGSGPSSSTSFPPTVFGVCQEGRWFTTLSPEEIHVEAISDKAIRLHKTRKTIHEIAVEDFERRCMRMRHWTPYSFDIPPVKPQRVGLRASWVDNEHLRAQRQDELDGIDELLDLTRAYHVIERWRTMVRKAKRERRQARKRFSQQLTASQDFEASYASSFGGGPLDGATTTTTTSAAPAPGFDDAAFSRRKLEVSMLVAFQKSRREKLRRQLASDYLLERQLNLPEQWSAFDISDLPAQAMFRVVVDEMSIPSPLSMSLAGSSPSAFMRSVRGGSSVRGTPIAATRPSPVSWRTVVTLPVLTWSDEGDVDRAGTQQHSAQYLKELLRLKVSKFVMVEYVTEKTITLSWSPVDYERIAQVVYDIQMQPNTPIVDSPSSTVGGVGGGGDAPQRSPTPALDPRRAELQHCREDINRAQQLEDKRIQLEYCVLITPVDDSTTLTSALLLGESGSPNSSVTSRADLAGSQAISPSASSLQVPSSGGTNTNNSDDSPTSGVGSFISVFLSGCAYAPSGTPSPFVLPTSKAAAESAAALQPREERFRSYQHHCTIHNLQPNTKYIIQVAQYSVFESRWLEPCPPILTCTPCHSVISIADFPSTGELNGSACCVVPDGLLCQLESTTKKSTITHNMLPRHAFSYSNSTTLELRVIRLRPNEGQQVVTTRSCSIRDGAKGLVFRSLEPNSAYKVTCKRNSAISSKFQQQHDAMGSSTNPGGGAVSSLAAPRRSRSSSKINELLATRGDTMSFTVFTIRCLPVLLRDIDATGLNIVVKRRYDAVVAAEEERAAIGSGRRSSVSVTRAPSIVSIANEGSGALVPRPPSTTQLITALSLSGGPDQLAQSTTSSNPFSDSSDDSNEEYVTLCKAHGVILLSNTTDTTVGSFDPLTLENGIYPVNTEGYDRIVVMATVARCFGTNEEVAAEELEMVWPKVTASLSLVVDWSLLPFSVSDCYAEFLLSPVHCMPPMDLTHWKEDMVETLQELGKHLKRLIEAREESNSQFLGLQAEVEIVEHAGESHHSESFDHSLTSNPASGCGSSTTATATTAASPRMFTISCSGKPVSIPGLKPRTVYTVRIRPMLGGGALGGKVTVGAWGPSITFRTAAPLLLDIDHVDDTSVTLHWQRDSPHDEHSLTQLQSATLPQPTAFPQFVTSTTDFIAFLYRHIVFGNYSVHYRAEGIAEEMVEECANSTHYAIKDLAAGSLMFIRVQQSPAMGLVGDETYGGGAAAITASDSLDATAAVTTEHSGASPTLSLGQTNPSDMFDNSETTSDNASRSEMAGESFEGPPSPSAQGTGGSWSMFTVCVRTVGELRAHITPMGDNEHQVIVARPGFNDQQYANGVDVDGRPIVVHKAKETPILFVQVRILSEYVPGTRGLLDVGEDGDLLPSYATTVVDGGEYWDQVAGIMSKNKRSGGADEKTRTDANAHHWLDRSGVTDNRMPFHSSKAKVSFDVVQEATSSYQRNSIGQPSSTPLRYYVVNLLPCEDMTYIFCGLRRGACHQLQVRSRVYPSVDRVPPSGLDVRATTGTVTTPWSQTSMLITYNRASLSLVRATETTVTLNYAMPEAPSHAPVDNVPLSRVDIEVIAFMSGTEEDGGSMNSLGGGGGGGVSSNNVLYDANDVPYRPRAIMLQRFSNRHSLGGGHVSTEEGGGTTSNRQHEVTLERLLPGGIALAVIVPYYGLIRGPTSAITVLSTVCPVAVRMCSVSTLYASVFVNRRQPLWAECSGGLEQFIVAKKLRCLALAHYRSAESRTIMEAAQTHRRNSAPHPMIKAISTNEAPTDAEEGQNVEGEEEDEEQDPFGFDVEVVAMDKEMALHKVPMLRILNTDVKGEYLLCNLEPNTLYRVRGRPLQISNDDDQNLGEHPWSRPCLFLTLLTLQLRLDASFETRCDFSITRRAAESTAPKWALREVMESLKLCPDESIEFGLLAPRSGASATSTDPNSTEDGAASSNRTPGQQDEAVPSSVVPIRLVSEVALSLDGLESGCSYQILARAVPITSRGQRVFKQPPPDASGEAVEAPKCFCWTRLGSVVTCPFKPTMPTLYEARGGAFVSLFWDYDAEHSHRLNEALKQYPVNRELNASMVSHDIAEQMRLSRVSSLCILTSSPSSSSSTASRWRASAAPQVAATLHCPPSYPSTPYSAVHVSFRIECVCFDHTSSSSLSVSSAEVSLRSSAVLGEVHEPFARMAFAIPHPTLIQKFCVRLKAVVSLSGGVEGTTPAAATGGGGNAVHSVESEWTPAYRFLMPPVALGPPQCLRMASCLGNRLRLEWDHPSHVEHSNQVCYQVQVSRGGTGWRDAVWMRGSSTQCIVHGLIAKEPTRVRVIAHGSFAPVEGIASSALAFVPFAGGRGLTADLGLEETPAMLQDIISTMQLAQFPFPCRISDDASNCKRLRRPSTLHAESNAGRPLSRSKRVDSLKVAEYIIADMLATNVGGGEGLASSTGGDGGSPPMLSPAPPPMAVVRAGMPTNNTKSGRRQSDVAAPKPTTGLEPSRQRPASATNRLRPSPPQPLSGTSLRHTSPYISPFAQPTHSLREWDV